MISYQWTPRIPPIIVGHACLVRPTRPGPLIGDISQLVCHVTVLSVYGCKYVHAMPQIKFFFFKKRDAVLGNSWEYIHHTYDISVVMMMRTAKYSVLLRCGSGWSKDFQRYGRLILLQRSQILRRVVGQFWKMYISCEDAIMLWCKGHVEASSMIMHVTYQFTWI